MLMIFAASATNGIASPCILLIEIDSSRNWALTEELRFNLNRTELNLGFLNLTT